MLSSDRGVRLRVFDEAVSDVNLPGDVAASWRRLVEERGLEDEEFGEILQDCRDTPIEASRALRREVMAGRFDVSTLVPRSARYFERLVGKYDGSDSVRTYARAGAKAHFQQLERWQSDKGLVQSLLLASDSSLMEEVGTRCVDDATLTRVFSLIREEGEGLSLVGAIEVGLRVLAARPAIEPIVVELVGEICDDDNWRKPYELLSALFYFVDGELAMSKVLQRTPPFYRRLAAFAQAGLIYRILMDGKVDGEEFAAWLVERGGWRSYLQSHIDMRREPRWNIHMAAPMNMRAYFLGRVMRSGVRVAESVRSEQLRQDAGGAAGECA